MPYFLSRVLVDTNSRLQDSNGGDHYKKPFKWQPHYMYFGNVWDQAARRIHIFYAAAALMALKKSAVHAGHKSRVYIVRLLSQSSGYIVDGCPSHETIQKSHLKFPSFKKRTIFIFQLHQHDISYKCGVLEKKPLQCYNSFHLKRQIFTWLIAFCAS